MVKQSAQSSISCISLSGSISFMALDPVYSCLLLRTNTEYKGVFMKMDVHFPLSTTKLELTTELELQLRIC